MDNYSTLPEYVQPSETPEVVPNQSPSHPTAKLGTAAHSNVYSTLPEYVPPPNNNAQQYTSDPKYLGGDEATGADAPEVAEHNGSKRKKKIWILAAVIIVVVIAAVVGAVCGTLLSKNDNPSSKPAASNKYVSQSHPP